MYTIHYNTNIQQLINCPAIHSHNNTTNKLRNYYVHCTEPDTFKCTEKWNSTKLTITVQCDCVSVEGRPPTVHLAMLM